MFHIFKKKYGLGIDISNHSIEAFSLSAKKDVRGYARVILDEGIIEDGKVKNKTELAEKIREVLEGMNPAQKKSGRHDFPASSSGGRVIASIPEMNIFLHFWKIPQEVEAKDRNAFVRENAKKLVPFGENAIYWDMIDVSNGVLYAAVEKDIIDEYALTMHLAGIKHYVFDAGSLSLGRALISQARLDELRKNHNLPVSVMIMDIGGRTTNVSIWNSRNVLCLSVTIPVAGNHFTRVIKEKFNISDNEAEKLKRTIGFDYKKGSDRTIVVMQLQADLQKILREVENALSYYEEEYGEKVVEVLLSGGSSLVPQIDSYIATNLDRSVRIGDPLPQINSPGGAIGKRESAVLFSNAIGLALRGIAEGEQGINLSQSNKKSDLSIVFPSSISEIFKSLAIKILFGAVFFFLFGWIFWRYAFVPKSVSVSPAPVPTSSEVINIASTTPDENNSLVATSTDLLSTADALSSTTGSGILNKSASIEETKKVVITKTPTGWLNVRENPDIGSRQISRVSPGQSFVLLEKREGWYKIDLGEGVSGFVSAQYAKLAL